MQNKPSNREELIAHCYEAAAVNINAAKFREPLQLSEEGRHALDTANLIVAITKYQYTCMDGRGLTCDRPLTTQEQDMFGVVPSALIAEPVSDDAE